MPRHVGGRKSVAPDSILGTCYPLALKLPDVQEKSVADTAQLMRLSRLMSFLPGDPDDGLHTSLTSTQLFQCNVD